MIGLDTNIAIRYFAQDDPGQAAQATRIIEAELTDDEAAITILRQTTHDALVSWCLCAKLYGVQIGRRLE